MVLQCVWTITRATLSTAVVAVIAEVRIAKDEKALDEVYNQCLSMEMERKLSFEQRESRKEEPFDPDKPPPEPPDILDAFENQRYISKLIQWSLEASKHERRRPHLVGGDVDLELGNKMPLFLPALPYQAT